MSDVDKLKELYEDMVEEEQKDIEKKNPTVIEQLLQRIEALEQKVQLLEGK